MNPRHLFAITFAVAISSIGAYASGITFPGKNASLSPSKKWKIECQNDLKNEGAYVLTLEDTSTGAKREIFQGGRSCDVLWNEDESSLAITDWLGSNCSDALIQSVNEDGPARQLPEIQNIHSIIPKKNWPDIATGKRFIGTWTDGFIFASSDMRTPIHRLASSIISASIQNQETQV